MRRIEKVFRAQVATFDELPEADQRLLGQAIVTREYAQAPYSEFYVGAAVMTPQFDVYTGANIENANWTATSHAEQNAVNAAIAAEGSGTRIERVAIVAAPKGTSIALPPLQACQTALD